MDIDFLTLAEVLEIHKNQIDLYGGKFGIRDISLLSSALAIPRATFDGNYLHHDVFEMAAAYIFHICQNHPFIDGNKRVALVAGLVFLDFNEVNIVDQGNVVYTMMMNVASGKYGKEKIAETLRKLSSQQ